MTPPAAVPEFAAEGRARWLNACLSQAHHAVRQLLVYPCGEGAETAILMDILTPELTVGVDSSAESLRTARNRYAEMNARFVRPEDYAPRGQFDVVVCRDMWRRLPGSQRNAALHYAARATAPGGLLAMWEFNRWSPAARGAMRAQADPARGRLPAASRVMAAMRRIGFDVLRVDRVTPVDSDGGPDVPAARPAAGLPTGSEFLVLGKKRSGQS